jgi:hypothetical protein
MRRYIGFIGLAAVLILAGCIGFPSPPKVASQTVTRAALLYSETFDQPADWHEYDQTGVQLTVAGGVYRAEISGGVYVWGTNTRMHTDVILEVRATQFSEGNRNGYGLICRADPSNDGDGYYFLVGGDGTASIRRGQSTTVEPLVAWDRADAVRGGIRTNIVRAECVGDYLALYVNGVLVAETRDALYKRGTAGVALVSLPDTPLTVEFDDFFAWEASVTP